MVSKTYFEGSGSAKKIKSDAPQKDINMQIEIHESGVTSYGNFISFWDALDFIGHIQRFLHWSPALNFSKFIPTYQNLAITFRVVRFPIKITRIYDFFRILDCQLIIGLLQITMSVAPYLNTYPLRLVIILRLLIGLPSTGPSDWPENENR